MIKKEILFSTILVLFLFIASCVPKPKEPSVTEPTITPTEEIPTTGEAPVDAVAEDISDAGTVDKELDTSELEDVEGILADIEKI